MSRARQAGGVAIMIAYCLASRASPACAQSLTAGEVGGVVRDLAGNAISEALITLTDVTTGLSRSASSARGGQYRVSLVPPGEYQVLVEHLGYRPVRVLGVLARPGGSAEVPVTLTPGPPPVTRVDTVRMADAASGGSDEWFSRGALRRLPDEAGGIADLGRLSTIADSDLATEGLPGSLSGLLLDGASYRPARHPGLPGGQFDAGMVRLSTLDGSELVANGTDVEWAGVSGGTLSGFSRLGTPRFQSHLLADWTGSAVSSSKYFDTGAVPNSTLRGALMFTGPIIRDSAQFVVAVEGRRLETPMPPAWAAGALVDSLATVARDSFGAPLNAYMTPHVMTTDAVTAFGGVNWQTSARSNFALDARYATANTKNPDLGAAPAPSLGAGLDTRDFFASAAFSSRLSQYLSQELRLGVESSIRTYSATTPAATVFAAVGAPVGSDPALPGRFQRTLVRGSETLHYEVGLHRVKFGVSLGVNSYDQTYAFGSGGTFFFSDPGDFIQRRGVFVQNVPTSPAAQFSVAEYGLFLQDLVTAAPGLDLLVGLRYDRERLPSDKVVPNQAWLQASGLDNTRFGAGLNKLSPRAGVTWDVGQRHVTRVQGAVGLYFDQVDPGILGEVITESVGDTVRRGVGSLAAWPNQPDLTHAPAVGSQLTLLAHNLQVPRSGRVSLGVWRSFGSGLTAQLTGSYRHTDYLPRRHDLNRPLAPSAHDQYGRPIYGTLMQEGGLLVDQPGTNRRFSGFDLVSAIDPDGYSDYWAVTIRLERQVEQGLHLLAAYTYSRTTDNWLSGRGGDPAGQLSPFPDSLGAQDWAKGRSDFDVPHRVVLAAELQPRLPLSARLAFIYRYRSGYPFTPGFRNGVDANGDGSASNDPAFVDGSIPGMSGLLSRWGCLRGQVGRFAERNGCREAGVHSLDLRATFLLVHPGGYPVELVVDGLRVLESDAGVRDYALYLVDASRTLSTNTTTGVVTVPLIANPGFGNVLVRRSTGRELRIGLRVNY